MQKWVASRNPRDLWVLSFLVHAESGSAAQAPSRPPFGSRLAIGTLASTRHGVPILRKIEPVLLLSSWELFGPPHPSIERRDLYHPLLLAKARRSKTKSYLLDCHHRLGFPREVARQSSPISIRQRPAREFAVQAGLGWAIACRWRVYPPALVKSGACNASRSRSTAE